MVPDIMTGTCVHQLGNMSVPGEVSCKGRGGEGGREGGKEGR